MKSASLIVFLFLLIKNSFSQNTGSVADTAKNAAYYTAAVTLENPLNSGKLGLVVVGVTVQNITRLSKQPDGNAGIYLGLGEPMKYVGAGATINIYGLSNKIGEQKNIGTGSLNLHINKLFFRNKLLLDAGVDNAFLWGNYFDKNYISHQRSFYFSSNYLLSFLNTGIDKPFSSLSITAGVGNGYFRSDKNYTINGRHGFDPFFSLATPVVKRTNFIAEWNGYDIGVGISSTPFPKLPFIVQFEVTDINFGTPRFVSSLAFPFNFRKSVIPQAMRVRAIRPVRTI
jgi:hypothetical protein